MNLRRLEYFTTLARTGNMRRAAEILRISTPALSKAMKVLEEELEIRLWSKEGRGVILTDSGHALLKRAPALIKDLNELKEGLHTPKQSMRKLRIGTFEIFSTYFLTFLDRIQWQDFSLELHELIPGQMEKHLADGQIDIGITYIPMPHPDLDFIKVTSIEMGVFTHKDAFKGVPQTELPFVVPVSPLQGAPTRVRGLDGWPQDAYARKILHEVTLLESAIELCRQGRVAGYFPVFIVNEYNKRVREEHRLDRRRSPFPGRVCRSDVFLVKRKSTDETQDMKKITKGIRLVCR